MTPEAETPASSSSSALAEATATVTSVGKQQAPIPTAAFLLCGSCARLGICQRGLSDERLLPDGAVETRLSCGAEHEGGPQVAHGGWTAGIFDELLGHVPLLHGQLAVTGTLTVKYVKPVPIGRALLGRAWPIRQEPRKWVVAGVLALASSGAVLSHGEAVMVLRNADHFDRHRAWLAEQERSPRQGH
jgi:acyl-coenzyme A thioesterase PaaI-like protein